MPTPQKIVGSHPYGYAEGGGNYNLSILGFGNSQSCKDLNALIGNWNYYYFSGNRHISTEDNYDSQPGPTYDPPQVATNDEAAYMMDVFSFMYNNLGGNGQWGYAGGEAAYPYNLMWFAGYDLQGASGQTLGLLQDYPYGNLSHGAVDKSITFTPYCPDEPGITYGHTLTYIMQFLRNEGMPGSLFSGVHCW